MKHQIVENIWIGDEQDSKDFWFSQQPHVSIDLTGWNIDYELSKENLDTVSRILPVIYECHMNKIPVLVYCHAGIDRSPFMVACFLYGYLGYTVIGHAYQTVKNMRPQTIIHDDWMKEYQKSIKGEY